MAELQSIEAETRDSVEGDNPPDVLFGASDDRGSGDEAKDDSQNVSEESIDPLKRVLTVDFDEPTDQRREELNQTPLRQKTMDFPTSPDTSSRILGDVEEKENTEEKERDPLCKTLKDFFDQRAQVAVERPEVERRQKKKTTKKFSDGPAAPVYRHDEVEPVSLNNLFGNNQALWIRDFDLQQQETGGYVKLNNLYFARSERGTKRVVFFEGKFQEISNISLKDETFNATLRIYCTWLASLQDLKNYMTSKKTWKPNWMPKIEMDNCVTDMEREIKHKKLYLLPDGSTYSWLNATRGGNSVLGFDARFGVWARAMYEFAGTFVEEFELQSFPFDCQDLKVILRCTNCRHIVPLPTQAAYLSLSKVRTALSDFEIRKVVGEFGIAPPDLSRGKKVYGEVVLVVKASRYWQSRLDVLLSEGILTFLTLLVFALEPGSNPETGDLGNRVNYLMTLILTDVALQQYAKDKLNDFEYLTALDKFIWASFLFKAIALVWVVVPFFPLWSGKVFQDQNLTNLTAAWIFTILFFVYVICCIAYFVTINHIEERKLEKSVLEIEQEYNENRNEYFSLRMRDENLLTFSQKKVAEGAHLRRWVQQAEKYSEGIGLDSRQEYHLYNSERIKHHDIVFELVGRKGVIVFGGFIALSMWGLNRVLNDHFRWETGIMFIICTFGSLTNWGWTTYRWQSESEKEISFMYYHNYWLYLSIIVTSIYSVLNDKHHDDPRALVMNILVICWYGCLMFFDFVYDIYNWKKNQEYSKTNVEIHNDRFVGRYLRIYSQLPDKDSELLKNLSDFSLLCLKHLVLGVNQAVQGFILLLPIFVVEHKKSKVKKVKFTASADIAGLVMFCFSGVLLLLSFIFWDSLSGWKDERKFLDVFCWCSTCTTNEREMADATVPRDENEEDDEKDGSPPAGPIHVAMGNENVTKSESEPMIRPTSEEKPRVEKSEETEPVFMTLERATSDTSVKWMEGDSREEENEEKFVTSFLNPYRVIRYPVRVSEMWLWVSMWIMSIVVYEEGFLIGIIGVLSPVYVILYHGLLIVPLLENLADDEFGEQSEYQQYKDRTRRFVIQL